jgi:hypothetical protein
MLYKTLVVFDMKTSLHCLGLRMFMKQLVGHGKSLKTSYTDNKSEVIKELEDGTFYRWRAGNQSLGENAVQGDEA